MKKLLQREVQSMIQNDCVFCDHCGDVVIIGSYVRQSFFPENGEILCPECYLLSDRED